MPRMLTQSDAPPTGAGETRSKRKYVGEFRDAVLAFLDFDPKHATLAQQIADAVTQHATPVGSGTVARNAADSDFSAGRICTDCLDEAPDNRLRQHEDSSR